MADQLKVERRTAKRLFTMAMNQLSKNIDMQKPIETIESKYETFKQRTNELLEKHATYLSVALEEDTEPTEAEVQWLEDIEMQVDLMESKFNQYVKANASTPQTEVISKQPTESSKISELKMAAKACHYESTTLDAMFNSLRISIFCEEATVEIIKHAQSDVKAHMDR